MKNIYVYIFATIAFGVSSIEACHYANEKGKRKFDDTIAMPCDLSLFGSPCIGTALDLSALGDSLGSSSEKSDTERRGYDEHKSPIQRPQNPSLDIPSMTLGENIISASEKACYRDNGSDSPLHKKLRQSRSLFESKETTTSSSESNNFPILQILRNKNGLLPDNKLQTTTVLKQHITPQVAIINLIMQYLDSEEAEA